MLLVDPGIVNLWQAKNSSPFGFGDRFAFNLATGNNTSQHVLRTTRLCNPYESPRLADNARTRAGASTWARPVGLVLGILELTGAVLWCIAGAGIYGSPLVGMSGGELMKVLAFLLAGPVSVLPAAMLARYRPRLSGLWLIGGGLYSAYLIVFSIPHPNLRGGLHFESSVPLLLVSVPMLIVGVWQMHAANKTSDP